MFAGVGAPDTHWQGRSALGCLRECGCIRAPRGAVGCGAPRRSQTAQDALRNLSEINFKSLSRCSARATEPTALTDLLVEGTPTKEHLHHPCGPAQTAICLLSITLNSLVPFSSLQVGIRSQLRTPRTLLEMPQVSKKSQSFWAWALCGCAPHARVVSGLLSVCPQHPTGSQLSYLCAWTASYCSTCHEGYNNQKKLYRFAIL